MSKPNVWGLTGGIASGKSTAAKLFAAAGIEVIDADQISRALTAPGGSAHNVIARRFGTAERSKLREIAFNDRKARLELEAILHPLILEESTRRIEEALRRDGSAIYEAPLLVETGRHSEMKGLIVVEAPIDVRVQRLIARDRINEEMARKIIASQATDAEKRRAATYLIQNGGTLEHLRNAIEKIVEIIAGHARDIS